MTRHSNRRPPICPTRQVRCPHRTCPDPKTGPSPNQIQCRLNYPCLNPLAITGLGAIARRALMGFRKVEAIIFAILKDSDLPQPQ